MYVLKHPLPPPACRVFCNWLQRTRWGTRTEHRLTSCICSDKFIYIATDITKEDPLQATLNLTGKAAVFVRGFMEYFGEHWQEMGEVPLRACQEAGLAQVQ